MQETDSQSQEQATATKAASAPAKSRTLWGDAFKRLRKNKLPLSVSAGSSSSLWLP